MRIAFTTLGCKINQYETDLMRREIVASGDSVVSFEDAADVYIINTCSVTSKSDYQCRQAIRSAVRRGRGAKVIVTGCYAQTRPEEIRNIIGVDLVIGNPAKECIGEITRSLIADNGKNRWHRSIEASEFAGNRTREFLKIQDGCDSRCSYCIVPLARGVSRSVERDVVLRRFEDLVEAECPEIVLSGIHIGLYGADLDPRTDLSSLLNALTGIRGESRLRLSSIEPGEVADEIIELLGDGLCRHLHIPLQSGDDTILLAMKRNYTSGFYRDLLAGIAGRVPGVALGADVMVGFPGEGEREFQNTVRLIEESPLTHLHVFSFSPRPGTAAAEMEGQVSETEKKTRSRILRDIGTRKNLEFRRTLSETETDVVIEDKLDVTQGCYTGFTDNYVRVTILNASSYQTRRKAKIRIKEVTRGTTLGILA